MGTLTPDAATSGVRRYLVTASVDLRMDTWAATGGYANWIDGRPNGDRETWLVTVSDRDSQSFLEAARNVGVTVEEIAGGGETESYTLVAGEPGSGWER